MSAPKEPAFPVVYRGETYERSDGGGHVTSFECTAGMSLRDWFAGQALAGLMRDNPAIMTLVNEARAPKWYATAAFMLADAMLAEREREVEP